MTKTGQEVKEGVRKCLSGVYCNMNCPYAELGKACQDELKKDTLEYIEGLEAKVAAAGKNAEEQYHKGYSDGYDAAWLERTEE